MSPRKDGTGSVQPTLMSNKPEPKKSSKPHISKKEIDQCTYKCVACGTEYKNQEKYFPYSCSPFYKGNNNRLPVCWNCFESAFNQYYEQLDSKFEAIKRICLHLDYYVDPVVANNVKQNGENRPAISLYLRQLNLSQNKGKTYDDYLDESKNEGINSVEEIEMAQDEGVSISKKTVDRWGYGFTPQDYEYLNSELSDWKSRCVVNGKSQEVLVQELCVIGLQKNKALIAGDQDGYRKFVDAYQRALKEANLSPKQEAEADKLQEIPMGKMIERFENERPIPQPRPEWRDVDGIMRVVLVYFIGHLCKMLGLKNRYSQMYEEEMKRWTVEVNELENADSEEVFEYLMNNNFDGVTLTGEDNGS